MEIKDRIIIALDFASQADLQGFIEKFDLQDRYSLSFVKVGMELFYAEGPKILEYLKSLGLKIFLDLKIHDIPNTAHGAISSLAKYQVDILNVHASGGIEMMKRAKQALLEQGSQSKLIAVTQLTSTDQKTLNEELNISGSVDEAVLRLADNSKKATLDGVVCSPLEASLIKNKLGKEFITVCPGVRLADNKTHDQKRISTPGYALANGADFIVMGRAFTEAYDPQKLFSDLCESLK